MKHKHYFSIIAQDDFESSLVNSSCDEDPVVTDSAPHYDPTPTDTSCIYVNSI